MKCIVASRGAKELTGYIIDSVHGWGGAFFPIDVAETATPSHSFYLYVPVQVKKVLCILYIHCRWDSVVSRLYEEFSSVSNSLRLLKNQKQFYLLAFVSVIANNVKGPVVGGLLIPCAFYYLKCTSLVYLHSLTLSLPLGLYARSVGIK